MAPVQEAWGGPGREREVDHGIDVDLLIQQAQRRVYERRLRVRDFFGDYDRFRCGRCTRQQFLRAVGGLCPGFRPKEQGALADRFTVEGPQVKWPQNVDYIRFIQVLDEVFGVQCLEGRPDVKVPRPGSALSYTGGAGGARPSEGGDERRAEDIVKRIALLTRTRGVDLSACYLYGQRTDAACRVHMRGSGKISRPMFLQRFPFLSDLSERDLEPVFRRFASENGTIDVHSLLRSIDAVLMDEMRQPLPCQAAAAPTSFDDEAQYDEAPEAEVEEEPLAQTIPPQRQDDHLAGRPPAPAARRPSSAESFRRAVSASRLNVEGNGMEVVGRRTAPSRPSSAVGLRNSASFRGAVTSAGEKERSLPPRPYGSATSTRSTGDGLRPDVAEASDRSANSTTIKPNAAAMEAAEEVEVLEAQIEEARPPQPLQRRRPSSAAPVSRPASAASRSSSAGRPSGSCWPANTVAAGRPSVHNPVYGNRRPSSAAPSGRDPWPRPATPVGSPEEVLAKLRSNIAERRIRVTDCFQDFDRLRKGVCTFSSLRSALTLVGLELEPQEYETLFELFQSGDGMFRYRDFCSEVNGEAIEVCMQLGSGPGGMTASRFKTDMGVKVNSALEELEAQVRRKAQVRRVELRSTFENFSRARPGHVTRAQFARVMAMHGFRFTEEQLNTICRAYCDTQDPQELNYLVFCEAIERPRSPPQESAADAGVPASPAGPQLTPAPPSGAPRSRPSRPVSGYSYGRAQFLATDQPAGQRPR